MWWSKLISDSLQIFYVNPSIKRRKIQIKSSERSANQDTDFFCIIVCQTGRTVLTTIHQPSSRLFHMFDKLILLSEGHTIYFGNARAASDYFSTKLGLVPQIPMNPADFVLDLASGNVNDVLMPLSLTQRAIKRQSSAVSTTTQKQPPTITKLDVQEVMSYPSCPLLFPAKEVLDYIIFLSILSILEKIYNLLAELVLAKKSIDIMWSWNSNHEVFCYSINWQIFVC